MKNAVRKILLRLCMAVFMFASLAGVAICMPARVLRPQAAGAFNWKTDGVFEMEDGVSLNLSDWKNGLRYIVKMDEEVRNFIVENEEAEYGFIISTPNLMARANGDYINMAKKVGGAGDKAKIYQEGDYYFANGCYRGITYNYLDFDFVAISYIKYGNEVRYTEYNTLARNNLYDTVNMAALNGYANEVFSLAPYTGDGTADNTGWYGSKLFPITVENSDEYDALVSIVDDEKVDLSDYTVIVKNQAQPTSTFVSASGLPTILSAELDTVQKLVEELPESIAMPDAVQFVARIRDVEEKYAALSLSDKAKVVGYDKVENLLPLIEGYDRVYKHDVDDGTVIPSYLKMNTGFVSTIGGTAAIKQDSLYGNVLKVTSSEGGRAALHFQNFPSVAKYGKLYFYVKTNVGCDIYLSDGITNDGWGENWHNTWSVAGLWCNAGTWRMVEVDVADGYVGTDFAIGFKTAAENFAFEISDVYGVILEKSEAKTSLTFGTITDSQTTNEHGKVYNIVQGWTSDNDLGSFAVGGLKANLNATHDSYRFYIYNPNESNVDFYLVDTAAWKHWDTTTLKAKAWTEVVISPETIEANTASDMVCCVTTGAGTAGWQISERISFRSSLTIVEQTSASLLLGVHTDTGTVNEYGKVYNITREQYYIDSNNTNTLGTLQANKLANALPTGKTYFYFWMYNPTSTVYNFHLAGDCGGAWTDSKDSTPLAANAWTKVTISAEDIALNKQGQWYVYLLGGDGAGSAKSGWQISTVYAGPDVVEVPVLTYLDHADVKDAIKLINALPDETTLADKAAVVAARNAYDALTDAQKGMIASIAKLTAAETAINTIEKANEVTELINSINPRDIDEDLVNEARTKYNALSDTEKGYVTNLALLEGYEAEIKAANELEAKINSLNTLIANLPDSVIMPDNLVFVSRIEQARDEYNALTSEEKGLIENYGKLRKLLSNIEGYTTLFRQSVDGVSVVPSHVPNYTSTIGGTATMGYDSYYGNYLKVTPDAGGKVAIQFKNFPDVSKYTKVYFNIRVVGASCDLYLSDGITNDGWGDNWHNTWSTSGYWANNGSWIQKEVAPSTGILSSNWALGLRTNTTDVSFEITDIVAYAPDLGTNSGLTFGNFTDSGAKNAYGTVYNFTQGWSSDADMGAFNQNALKNALASGHDSLHFWIYNPNDSAVDFRLSGDMNSWNPTGEYVTNLPSKVWTEVVVTPDIIEQGNSGTWFVGVTTGAGASGWQISPIYSFNTQVVSEDAVSTVQARIDALDTSSPNEEAVNTARTAYEALSESEKALITIDSLITCETALYGDCAKQAFITNSASQYKIYYEGGLRETALYMQEQLASATGATLSLVRAEPTTITKYRYAVMLGYEELAQKLGFTDLPTEAEIGTAGYAIRKIGRTVIIFARGEDGYRMGMLAFLRATVGYEMLSEDCIVYNGNGETLPSFNLKEKPSFEYRQQQTYMTADEVFGMGLQAHTDVWIPSNEGWDMHNALHYLPVATYGASHPNWYIANQTQICPTAGGNSAEFNAMVDVIATNMMVQINAKPTIENISFSIMDSVGGDACTCARCSLYNRLYGRAGFSAAWIDLMNAINAKIRPQIGDRKLNIAFLAYRSTEAAPANDDLTLMKRYEIADDGSYTKTSEDLKCDDGVMVWLAPINALYAENFNYADNATHLATIKKWCALSSNVYLWMYGTNFKFYMYPYNTWKASAENYKILADLGVKGVWSQSNETEATAFSDLKAYIDSKFMYNVNADYDEVLNTYFTNYFGAGATKMRNFFDKVVAKCEEIEANYAGLGRGIYDEIENTSGFLSMGGTKYWTKTWLEECVSLCDEAKAAIDADTKLTDAQKTAFKNRITKESLFPRYVLCTSFANSYSSTNKKAMRSAFKADATALGLTLYREANGALSDLYSDWGI